MNGKLWLSLGSSSLLLAHGGMAQLTKSKTAQPQPVKPNIIYILADDMGYGDIYRLNAESKIKTPNLDRLCDEGMYFSDAHSNSAVSTPTRYGILTGRYCFRSPLKKGVLYGYDKPLIERDRPTVASILRERGYTTSCIGKWHLGLGWQALDPESPVKEGNVDFGKDLTYSPNEAGFDYSYIIPASLDMPPYVYIENHKVTDPQMDSTGKSSTPRGRFWRGGEISRSFSIESCLDHLTGRAQAYIASQQGSQQPFFLYFPLTAPHTPWLPAGRFRGTSGAGTYGDFVAHVDDVVARIVATVDSLGMGQNTMIVFTSDNGADWNPQDQATYPHKANYLYRGRKSDAWDAGHHVPFIVRYPAMVRPGTSSTALVCLTDLAATCAEMTGTAIPAGAAQDSESFLSALKGSNKARTSVVHHSISGYFAIRQGKWKLVDCSGSGGWSLREDPALPAVQLYDMENDPGETANLYQKYPQKVAELQTLLAGIIKN